MKYILLFVKNAFYSNFLERYCFDSGQNANFRWVPKMIIMIIIFWKFELLPPKMGAHVFTFYIWPVSTYKYNTLSRITLSKVSFSDLLGNAFLEHPDTLEFYFIYTLSRITLLKIRICHNLIFSIIRKFPNHHRIIDDMNVKSQSKNIVKIYVSNWIQLMNCHFWNGSKIKVPSYITYVLD